MKKAIRIDDRIDDALNLFRNHYNCSQAVLSSFASDIGLAREIVIKIATPFGGGIARNGHVCGAVIGALLLIGLKRGMKSKNPAESKNFVYDLTNEYLDEFKSRHGSIFCRELIEYDLSNPEQYQKAKEADVFEKRCTKYIIDSIDIVSKMLDL